MKEHLHTLIQALLNNNEEDAQKALSEAMNIKSTLKLKEEMHHGPGEIDFVLPSAWANYLKNGEDERLGEEEIGAIDAFMNEHGLMEPYEISEPIGRQRKHDASQFWPHPATVSRYTFLNDLNPEKLGLDANEDEMEGGFGEDEYE